MEEVDSSYNINDKQFDPYFGEETNFGFEENHESSLKAQNFENDRSHEGLSETNFDDSPDFGFGDEIDSNPSLEKEVNGIHFDPPDSADSTQVVHTDFNLGDDAFDKCSEDSGFFGDDTGIEKKESHVSASFGDEFGNFETSHINETAPDQNISNGFDFEQDNGYGFDDNEETNISFGKDDSFSFGDGADNDFDFASDQFDDSGFETTGFGEVESHNVYQNKAQVVGVDLTSTIDELVQTLDDLKLTKEVDNQTLSTLETIIDQMPIVDEPLFSQTTPWYETIVSGIRNEFSITEEEPAIIKPKRKLSRVEKVEHVKELNPQNGFDLSHFEVMTPVVSTPNLTEILLDNSSTDSSDVKDIPVNPLPMEPITMPEVVAEDKVPPLNEETKKSLKEEDIYNDGGNAPLERVAPIPELTPKIDYNSVQDFATNLDFSVLFPTTKSYDTSPKETSIHFENQNNPVSTLDNDNIQLSQKIEEEISQEKEILPVETPTDRHEDNVFESYNIGLTGGSDLNVTTSTFTNPSPTTTSSDLFDLSSLSFTSSTPTNPQETDWNSFWAQSAPTQENEEQDSKISSKLEELLDSIPDISFVMSPILVNNPSIN